MIAPYPPVVPQLIDDERTDAPRELGNWPRRVDVLLGLWLVITPFLWSHSHEAALNAWITGALIGAFSIGALYIPRLRVTNTILALWLFASAFIIPHASAATVLVDVIVSIAVFVSSLFAGRAQRLPNRSTWGVVI